MSLYDLTDVSKTYANGTAPVSALDRIDLNIDAGEFVSIVGPSGSGKTTLLQLLGALDRPTTGAVAFERNDLATRSDAELADLRRTTLGFIFQQFNLIPTLTACGNVEAALAPSRLEAQERRDRAAALLADVGLGARAEHLPSQLSGGEQQRVAIARALANSPRVLLADEPTGNLDTATGEELLALLTRLWRETGLTIVLVTHDREIAAAAGRELRMRDGRFEEP